MRFKEYIFAGIYAAASFVEVTAGVEDSRLLAPSKKLGDEISDYNLLVYDNGPKMVIKFIVNHGKIQYYTVYQNEPAPNFRSISRIVGSDKYEDGYVIAFNESSEKKLMGRAMVIYMQHNPTGSKLEVEWIRLSENIKIMKQILSDKANYGELLLLDKMK